MSEEFSFSEDGQPENINFATYLLPSMLDLPDYKLDHIISPNPFTPGGYKGAGETGTVSPVPCLVNAVEDALRPEGLDVYKRLPLMSVNVWHELQRARGVEA
jgi:aerobic carbon-monoxide dehydrogenase large subunit